MNNAETMGLHIAPTLIRVGNEDLDVGLIWEAGFHAAEPWEFEAENDGTYDFVRDESGLDFLQLNATGRGGVTAWLTRSFPADVAIEIEARHLSPKEKRHLSVLFGAGAEQARTAAETTRAEEPGMYQEFPNYLLTQVADHSRLRRNPGFEMLSEETGSVAPQGPQPQLLVVVKTGGRIRVVLDGKVIHEVTDAKPHGAGWLGLRTWNASVEIRGLRVYSVEV
ncbi:MAG: DUF6250 domain-containing protein [Planctomycetota bacterium]